MTNEWGTLITRARVTSGGDVGRRWLGPALLGPLLLVSGAACRDPGLCTSETRFLDAQATLGGAADTTPAHGWFALSLAEWRGGTTTNSVSYGFQTSRAPEDVALVEIRTGAARGGDLLYRLPTWDDPPWTPSGLAPQVYVGPIPFADFLDLIRAGGAHVEVTFRGDAAPSLVGPLVETRYVDWGGSDLYCS
jgi:hypothetical protein